MVNINRKSHYRLHKNQLLDLTFSHITHHICKIFEWLLHRLLGHANASFLSDISKRNFVYISHLPILFTCLGYVALVGLMAQSCEEQGTLSPLD